MQHPVLPLKALAQPQQVLQVGARQGPLFAAQAPEPKPRQQAQLKEPQQEPLAQPPDAMPKQVLREVPHLVTGSELSQQGCWRAVYWRPSGSR